MDQHPVPRQITTFEFKLVGFLTIKQFIIVLVFILLGLATYAVFPIPILNVLTGIIVGGIGVAIAFIPINDRPMEVWIKNLIKRLFSPTQYLYKKSNPPIYFFDNLVFTSDPHRVIAHIDSQQKLNNYMSSVSPNQSISHKQSISNILADSLNIKLPNREVTSPQPSQEKSSTTPPANFGPKNPFFTGTIKNKNNLPLVGILVYVKKDEKSNKSLRILKTNHHGVFATFSPLPGGEYFFEIKDPNNQHYFDTMKIAIKNTGNSPITITSKELM